MVKVQYDGKSKFIQRLCEEAINNKVELGETENSAYRGDRGKIAYEHSQSTHARTDATNVEKSSTNGNIKINGTETTVYTHPSGTNPHGTTKSDVGLGNVGNFKAVSTVANQGLSDIEKANARANIGAGTSSFSGSYNDLTNKPTIPTNTNQLTNGAGYITSSGTAKTISDTLPISKGGTGQTTGENAANALINSLGEGTDTPSDNDYYISQYVGGGTTTTTYHRRPMSALWNYIKSKLATVATSGSYNDLSNKPTIPTVGNGTVTIKQAGTSKGTFTMNQTGDTTIELTDNNTTYGVATQSANGLESAADKKKLDGIATGAEVNQNAFSNVVIGSTTISADSKTDSLTLVGSNVTLTPDAINDKVTIGITKVNVTSALGYTPPTTNTTYGVATSSALGLVKSGTDITVDNSGNVSINDDSHNHVISNVDGLQNALDGKASSSHTHNYAGSSSAGGSANSAVSVVDYGNTSKTIKIGFDGAGATTSNLGHIAGYLTGGTQIKDVSKDTLKSWLGLGSAAYTNSDAYAASSHTHSYAGSSSAGGSATSAVKLDSSAGSATQPVYFSGGKPVACSYTLGKSVPSNAVFTDTNTWRSITTSLTSTSTDVSLAASAGKSLQDQITTLNSKLLKCGVITTGSFSITANTLTIVTACSESDFTNWKSVAGISTILSIWVDGGYGDNFQMTASEYGGQLMIQIQSKYAATVTSSFKVYIIGI